jgi:hypothetical protein
MSTATNTIDKIIKVLELAVPAAIGVTAMIGGVPVPIGTGLEIAKTFLPIADSLILDIGSGRISIDTTGITPEVAKENLQTEIAAGWPVLTFAPDNLNAPVPAAAVATVISEVKAE